MNLQIITVLILGLLSLIGLLVNTARKIFIWLRPLLVGVSPLIYGIMYGIVISAILTFFVVSRIPNNGVPRIIIRIAHYALGFFVYIMLFVNFVDLLLFLAKILRLVPRTLSQQTSLIIGSAVLLIAVGLSIYGMIHSLSIKTRSYEVKLHQLREGEESDSIKIALISDIHLGYIIEENQLKKIVKAVNDVKPDIVCIAGDIIDGDMTSLKAPDALQAILAEIKASYGVYACLGNHDAGASYQDILKFLEGANVRVLQDEAVVIDNRFVIAGRKDSSPIGGQGDKRGEFKIPVGAEKLPVIMMDHQPANIREYENNADLILAGHTHKGQMFPFNYITNAMFDVDYGYYQRPNNGAQVIVTSGAGTWGPPQRVASDSEVVSIKVLFPKID